MRGNSTTRTATIAVAGTALAALLLTGCSAFGGDDPLPKPTRQSSVDGSGQTSAPDPTLGTEQAGSKQAVPAGTVVAETDAVSKSGDTTLHVRVVADDRGTFEAEFSDYRTTEPQPMTVEFRRTAKYGDSWDNQSVGQTTWGDDDPAPTSVTLQPAGAYPDFLRDVVLVPAASGTDDDLRRPWVGSVLAVGALDWKIPNPFPDIEITVGKERPGAYGYVFDQDGKHHDGHGTPSTYQVAHGDEQIVVAQRFGITVAQLRWLNPMMQVRDDGWIFEDTTLNLDPDHR